MTADYQKFRWRVLRPQPVQTIDFMVVTNMEQCHSPSTAPCPNAYTTYTNTNQFTLPSVENMKSKGMLCLRLTI